MDSANGRFITAVPLGYAGILLSISQNPAGLEKLSSVNPI